ncbi:MAG TPA: DUF4062 domain-containing protein [Pyrinomonadaceae bacterium]
MKLRPTIFLSGVSSEFASFRDAVEVEVQKKGCFADNQSSFGVDYCTVEEMVRRRISEADAVIHIVGFRFGSEPKDRPADKARRSYTQLEYDIARELQKPIYAFLSSDASICDALDSDDAEAAALQLAHRQAIQDRNVLYYFFKDKAELCKLAGEIEAVVHADFRVDISRIDKYAPAELIGREDELALLDDAWLKVRRAEPKRPHILTFVALGGEGKTSLVAKWLANLSFHDWPGCDSAFAWSFYSQGTRDQSAASSDLFLKEAITFFGNEEDKLFAASAAGAYEKGQHLARIINKRRSLLILDGVEPLQYSPTSPTPGELKDSALAALLKGLAADSDGLCIVTTRYSIPNLRAFWQTTAPELSLLRLSNVAGVDLLQKLGVKGEPRQFERLVEDVMGHALTLNLIGTYLRDAHGGDIRRRDLVRFEEANAEEQGGHAFRVIEAYEQVFKNEGDRGQRALAILRLLGLFDRPVSSDCFAALVQSPVIVGLTESLIGSRDTQLNLTFKRLEDAHLLTVNREASGTLVSFDGHPLLHEYFAQQFRTQLQEGWRNAHQRLFKHLCDTTPDKEEPTLEELQPLYQAIIHGCCAGLQQEACIVYRDRIRRKDEQYSLLRLNAYGSDLGAMANFFETPWSTVSPGIVEPGAQAWLLTDSSYCLRALGRLMEALEPVRSGLAMRLKDQNWKQASIAAYNLSDIEVTIGKIEDAVIDAQRATEYADQSKDVLQQIFNRAAYANALHQAGREVQAEEPLRQAQKMQAGLQPEYPVLYSLQGFRQCDLLLQSAERSAWRRTLDPGVQVPSLEILGVVFNRAVDALKFYELHDNPRLLDFALERLTLARAALYQAVIVDEILQVERERANLRAAVDDAVESLRITNAIHHLPRGLLTRSWFRFITDTRTGTGSAQEDLDEAWDIAERGPMKLFMADIHLYRARLFFREKEYPWESAEADLKAARKLIEQCGYWRRKEELEDAERVILKKSV